MIANRILKYIYRRPLTTGKPSSELSYLFEKKVEFPGFPAGQVSIKIKYLVLQLKCVYCKGSI